MMKQKYSFWHFKESLVFVSFIVALGFLLQLIFGEFDISFLRAPLNIIVGAVMILSLIASSLFRTSWFYRWLSGVPLSVTLIIAIGLLAIFMGLIPQVQKIDPNHQDIYSRIGLRSVTTSWYFVSIYFFLLLSLGATIIKRIYIFSLKNYAFYFNHIGLWVLLFATGMGAADRERYMMYAFEGKEESKAYNSEGEQVNLPITIALNDFDMEEYPPKLVVVDNKSLVMQPENAPSFYQIDYNNNTGRLLDWKIEIQEYIHRATEEENGSFKETKMSMANPAVKVKAVNLHTGEAREGWVSFGNKMQTFTALRLNDDYSIVMTGSEPKRFVSDLSVSVSGKEGKHVVLEVNKPFRTGNWMIYQYGYDNKAGKLSAYSILEIVYDPWIYGVYIGIVLLAAGSVCLLWGGRKRLNLFENRDTKNDVE